jgi:hypothetical protein
MGKRHPPTAVLMVFTLAPNQQNFLRQITAWTQALDQRSCQRLPLRRNHVPSEATIRRVLRDIERRYIKLGPGEVTSLTYCAITSLNFQQADAANLLTLWRQH